MRCACRSENTNSPLSSIRLMNSNKLSPSMDAKNDSPNFFISFWAATSPMVGIRLSDLSTAFDCAFADRLLGRISVHSRDVHWPHLLRDSPPPRLRLL